MNNQCKKTEIRICYGCREKKKTRYLLDEKAWVCEKCRKRYLRPRGFRVVSGGAPGSKR